MDNLNRIKDGLKLLFQANKEWAYTMDAKITLQQGEVLPSILKSSIRGKWI